MDRKAYEAAAKKTWDSDPEIRKEFLTCEIWLGYCLSRLDKDGKFVEPHECRCQSVSAERAV